MSSSSTAQATAVSGRVFGPESLRDVEVWLEPRRPDRQRLAQRRSAAPDMRGLPACSTRSETSALGERAQAPFLAVPEIQGLGIRHVRLHVVQAFEDQTAVPVPSTTGETPQLAIQLDPLRRASWTAGWARWRRRSPQASRVQRHRHLARIRCRQVHAQQPTNRHDTHAGVDMFDIGQVACEFGDGALIID